MPKKVEKEYQEMKEMAEKAGIIDLSKMLGEYNELVRMSTEYLQATNPKYIFSTLDCSTC